ncbi:MAG: radical SAM protein [bacterium]|nr:radical SAM protein [bacterium]
MSIRQYSSFRKRLNSARRIWYFKTRYTNSARLEKDYTCPYPTEYTIETGAVCNLRCPGCPTGRRRKGLTKGVLTYDQFRVVFDKIMPYALRFHLFNWGEPFLNQDILPMISLSAAHGIATQIDSNLTLREFSAEEAEATVSSGLSRLTASIDGASQATYEKYRIGGNFARALKNLESLRKARDRLGLERPRLVWKFLVNALNEHEMEKAKAIAAGIGVPITFDLMDLPNESWRSSFHPKLATERATTTEIRIQGENVEVTSPSRLPVLSNREGETNHLLPQVIDRIAWHPELFGWCTQPFKMMLINVDGNVFPCCNVYGDEYALGNLYTESMDEIWNNAKFRKCRRFIFNFGPQQDTGSVCETLPCPVERKFV